MIDPRTLMTYAAGAALVLAVAAAGTQTVRLANERAGHANTKVTHAETLRTLSDLTAAAYQAAQAEDARRNAELRKVSDDGQIQIDAARADAAAAARAAGGLRKQLAAYVAAVRGAAGAGSAGAADAGPPATEAVVVLADMFGSADARAGELAAAFDASHAAGITCERSYDALKGPHALPNP